MKRDMELVRSILRAIQEKSDLKAKEIFIDGEDPLLVGRHIAMLFEAGYIDGVASQTMRDPYKHVLVRDLTWEGHEFAGVLLAEEGVWQKLKATIGPENLAAMSLKTIQDVGQKALTAWAVSKLGL